MRQLQQRLTSQAGSLYVVTGITAIGTGGFYAVSAIYATTVISLSPLSTGVALGVSGVAGAAGAYVYGYFADRYGYRNALTISLVLLAVCYGSMATVSSFIPYAVVAGLVGFHKFGGHTARLALIGTGFPKEAQQTVRAGNRIVTNIGISVGAALGGIPLAMGNSTGPYKLMFLSIGAVTLAASPLAWRLTNRTGRDAQTVANASEVTNNRGRHTFNYSFILAAISGGVFSLYFGISEFGTPVWITRNTDGPHYLASVALIINTALVVIFQMKVAARVTDLRSSSSAALLASGVLMCGCLTFSFTSTAAGMKTVALISLAVVFISMGEVIAESVVWQVTFDLAEKSRMGEYQALSQAAQSIGHTCSPLILSLTVFKFGSLGWAVVAVLFVVAGLAMFLATRRRLELKNPETTGDNEETHAIG